jgi:hypothetical protein
MKVKNSFKWLYFYKRAFDYHLHLKLGYISMPQVNIHCVGNQKLQMMRKSCVGWDSSSNVTILFNFQLHQDLFNKQHKQKEERGMRGGRLIQFPTKGDIKSNLILKKEVN